MPRGQTGYAGHALAAIDVALWDIKGKALGQPLWKLLGGHRAVVPTYASGSLRRGLTDRQAEQAARILLQKGFRSMKTQMALPGDPTPAEEVRRMRVVRDAIPEPLAGKLGEDGAGGAGGASSSARATSRRSPTVTGLWR